MARAKLTQTQKARKGPQPVCTKCRQAIEPGQMRYSWSFFRGATLSRHQACGAPRPSELTQSNASELYAAQEAIQDALAARPVDDIDSFNYWRDDIASMLDDASATARDVGEMYAEAAEPFGGQGDNQDRADACEDWASMLDDGSSNVTAVEVDVDVNAHDRAEAFSLAIDDAIDSVEQAANDALDALEI